MNNPDSCECREFAEQSRKRAICDGSALDMPLWKINDYRSRWGFGPLPDDGRDRPAQMVHPWQKAPDEIAVTANLTKVTGGCRSCGGEKPQQSPVKLKLCGPGTELLAIYDSRGFPECDACRNLAKRMDVWGVSGCEKRIDQIVADILPRAKEWMKNNHPIVHLFTPGVVEDLALTAAIRRDVLRAIEEARLKAEERDANQIAQSAQRKVAAHGRRFEPGVRKIEFDVDDSWYSTPVDISRVAIVAVHFNPAKYRAPVENFFRFREGLEGSGGTLVTAELSFDGLFAIEDATFKISGDESNLYWQKEALVNYVLHRIDETKFDAVAWVDADLLWRDKTWLEQAVEKLNSGLQVVQCFGVITYLDSQGGIERTTRSWWKSDSRVSFSCGGAFIARLSTLRAIGGLYPFAMTAGDTIALPIFTGHEGQWRSWAVPDGCTDDLRTSIAEWQKQGHHIIRGRGGFIDVECTHLYHGTRAKRKYLEVATELAVQYKFQPSIDLRHGANGVLQWTGANPRLQQAVSHYFHQREEDA